LKNNHYQVQHFCPKKSKIITRRLQFKDNSIYINNIDLNNLNLAENIMKSSENNEQVGLVPIAFNSSIISSSMKHWHISELELQSIVNNNKKWEKYLLPRLFINVTDHLNLIEILNYCKLVHNSNNNNRLLRQASQLAVYNFLAIYMAGDSLPMSLPDYLSRAIQHDLKLDPTLRTKLEELDTTLLNEIDNLPNEPNLEKQINDHFLKLLSEKVKNIENTSVNCLDTKFWSEKFSTKYSLNFLELPHPMPIPSKRISINFVNLRQKIQTNPELKRQFDINRNRTRILNLQEKMKIIRDKFKHEAKQLSLMQPTYSHIPSINNLNLSYLPTIPTISNINLSSLPSIPILSNSQLIVDKDDVVHNLLSQHELSLPVIHKAQLNDKHLAIIIRYLLDKNGYWYDMLDLKMQQDIDQNKYFLHSNASILMYRTPSNEPSIVIPQSLIMSVIHIMHNNLLTQHNGVTRTYALIRDKFYWQGMLQDITYYIAKCAPCQMAKKVHVQCYYALETVDPEGPNEVISIDSAGPFPEDQGFVHYTTILDHFDNYLKIIPTKNVQAITLGNIILNEWIFVYGPPRYIVSDNGSGYIGDTVKLLYNIFHIKLVLTTPYNARANGRNEKTHQYINNILTVNTMMDSNHDLNEIYLIDHWTMFLKAIEFSYNVCPNRINGIAPFELRYGIKPNINLHESLVKLQNTDMKSKDLKEYAVNLLRKIKVLRHEAILNRREYNKLKKKQIEQSQVESQLEVGEEVMVRRNRAGKHHTKWLPGFKILKRMENGVTYKIINVSSGDKSLAHRKDLTRYSSILHNQYHQQAKELREKFHPETHSDQE